MKQHQLIKCKKHCKFTQLFFLVCSMSLWCSCAVFGSGQSEPPKTIPDIHRPTSLYSQIQISPQWESSEGGANLIGVRGGFSKSWNDRRHQITGGIFRLYNDQSGKMGTGDAQIRYMGTFRNNPSPTFGSIAGFFEVSLPTGNYDHGLGTSQWKFSPGIMGNLTLNQNIELFPALSYSYATTPTAEAIPEEDKFASHDLSLDTIAVFNFDSWFLWVTPTLTLRDLDGTAQPEFQLEIRPTFMVANDRIKLGAAFNRDFENSTNTIKAFVGIIR